MGYRECEAISSCLKFATVGKSVNDERFRNKCSLLELKYYAVRGPFLSNSRYTVWLEPGVGEFQVTAEDYISHVSLEVIDNLDIEVSAYTFNSRKISIFMMLPSNSLRLFEMDCSALSNILSFMTPGYCFTDSFFSSFERRFRSQYNFFEISETSETNIKARLLASRVNASHPNDIEENPNATDPIEPASPESNAQRCYEDYVDKYIETQHSIQILPHCPYPGIKYTSKMLDSHQAQVYAGITADDVKVAVKVFKDAKFDALETYRTELKAILRVPLHPNIVRVEKFFESPSPALVTRLVGSECENIFTHLQNHGSFSEEEGRRLAVEIVEGVAHLHRYGIVHRYLKTPNIVLESGEDGGSHHPVIIDFGVSMEADEPDKQSVYMSLNEVAQTYVNRHPYAQESLWIGTIPWMAPEMISTHDYSEKSDVYAVGIILWEIFSGRIPFDHLQSTNSLSLVLNILRGNRPDVSAISDISQGLQFLISKMWSEDPSDRPTMLYVLDTLNGNDSARIFGSIDKDGSKSVTYDEMVSFFHRAQWNLTPEQCTRVFVAIDEDGDNEISFAEFRNFWEIVEREGVSSALSFYQRTATTIRNESQYSSGEEIGDEIRSLPSYSGRN